MSDAVTYAIELAVGLGCLGFGIASLGRSSLRPLAVLLLVASAAATVHATAKLVG